MTSGFKAVQERAIQFQAEDLQDVLRLHSNFAQKQMQSYARQAQELGQLMAEAMRSSKPQA